MLGSDGVAWRLELVEADDYEDGATWVFYRGAVEIGHAFLSTLMRT